jgi:uncharacterized NAD(P)/FAD-binding protein YdhS
LVDPNPRAARGVAYGTECPEHVLNVPASNMSALPDDPQHLLRWLQTPSEGGIAPLANAAATSFVPRSIYGHYLQDLLEQTVRSSSGGVVLTRRRGTVTDLEPHTLGVAVRLEDEVVQADAVVLALGVTPPPPLATVDHELQHSPRYIGNVWQTDALSAIAADDQPLIVGSGLTMVDVVLALRARGHHAPISVLSRNGRMPRSHRFLPPASSGPIAVAAGPSLVARLRALRLFAEQSGQEAEQIVDGLRGFTPTLWATLNASDKQRFLRHLRSLWDVLRHRVGPEVGRLMQEQIERHSISPLVGHLLSARLLASGVEITYRDRVTRSVRSLKFSHLINALGLDPDITRTGNPLVSSLFARGLVAAGPCGIGLATAPDGALRDRDGNASERLFTLGPPRRGDLWESIAIPELRVQAQGLAARLVSGRVQAA